MVADTILQHEILTRFVYPFLLIFFIVFAILEKTKLLGDGKKQINALLAFVIGLIFVSVAYPKMVVGNLILFLTVAIVIVFITLLIWGFVSGKTELEFKGKAIKIILGIGVVVSVIIAVFWATGLSPGIFDFLFKQSWSDSLWTNVAFIVVIAIALAVVLKNPAK